MAHTRLVLSAPARKPNGRSVHSLGLRPVFKHLYLRHIMFFLDIDYFVMDRTVFPLLDSPEPKPLILYLKLPHSLLAKQFVNTGYWIYCIV